MTTLYSDTGAANISSIWRYTARIYKSKSPKQAILYVLRSYFFYAQTKQWQNYISQNPLLMENNDTLIELVTKVYRPFLRTSYSLKERVSLLIAHLNIMMEYFPPALTRAILGKQKVELLRLEGKKEQSRYMLTLSRNIKFDKEGDLTIALQTEDSTVPLATVTFAFGYSRENRPIVIVGGLQGPTPAGEENKRMVIQATRDLNGLRPKRAVIEALCAIARQVGAAAIHCPSNKMHISKILAKKKQSIYSDYDQFWAEIGGVMDTDNTYIVPVTLPKRDIADVPAKKRKDWLARTEHLHQISMLAPGVFTKFS